MANDQPNRPDLRQLRVWLVHDWLNGMRGGERVLLRLVRMFPQAKIATLFYVPGATCAEIEARIERVSFLQYMPGVERHYRDLLPLMPLAIRGIELPPHDLVISTSHCVAKGIRTAQPHLCYCFTPMRYVWEMREHYQQGAGASWKMAAARALGGPLRDADLAMNEGVTRFACTCRNVAARIERCYGRTAEVIYPGVEGEREEGKDGGEGDTLKRELQTEGRGGRDYYLVVSALVPYKRVDLAVEAFGAGRLRGKRLVVIGKGPEEERLRKLAARGGGQIEFLGWRSDEEVREYYERARALIFPGEEDFGLTPLEAQACGTPVVAYGRGGALETVTAETGVLFGEQTVEALTAAVLEVGRRKFDRERLRAWAGEFSWERFDAGMERVVGEIVGLRNRLRW